MKTNMDIKEIRKKNAKYLIDACGSQKNAIARLGREQSLVSQWKNPTKKPIGDDVARLFDESFSDIISDLGNNPGGWMDLPHYDLWGEDPKEPEIKTYNETAIKGALIAMESFLAARNIKLSPARKANLLIGLIVMYKDKESAEAIKHVLQAALVNNESQT